MSFRNLDRGLNRPIADTTFWGLGGGVVALRFQGDDEVDRKARREGRVTMVFLLIFVAAIEGVVAWIRGDRVSEYISYLGILIAFGIAYWLLAPLYHEFRIRTKEIDGKVSAIEVELRAAKDEHAGVLKKLAAIEEKLDANWRDRG